MRRTINFEYGIEGSMLKKQFKKANHYRNQQHGGDYCKTTGAHWYNQTQDANFRSTSKESVSNWSIPRVGTSVQHGVETL